MSFHRKASAGIGSEMRMALLEQIMRNIISISEKFEAPDHTGHIQATADAVYDEQRTELIVRLQNVELLATGAQRPGKVETVKIKLGLGEAIPAAKDVFRCWIKKMLQTGKVCIQT